MFSITLTNFRSFHNQTFDFNNFNILIGENSSGKSSIFKFLLALKQSLQPPDNREINMLFKGEYVDLGSYTESIYYHKENLPLSFSFKFAEQQVAYFYEFMVEERYKSNKKTEKFLQTLLDDDVLKSSTELSFTLTKELNNHQTIKSVINNSILGELHFEYPTETKISKSLNTDLCDIFYDDKKAKTRYRLKDVGYNKDGFMTIIEGTDLRSRCRTTFIPEGLTLQDLSLKQRKEYTKAGDRLFYRVAFLLLSQNLIRDTLTQIEYINPIHTSIARYSVKTDKKLIFTINDLNDVLAYFTDMDAAKKTIFEKYVRILKKLGIADDIVIIEDQRLPIQELRVKVKDLTSNISDVGYGVSLQLPIILKALLAELSGERKFILIEQPEVHLHPKLHASLVEALLSLSKNTTYFIETHSEHIVRKLQVAVKESHQGKLADQITVHYLVRQNDRSVVSSHCIGRDGLFESPFPSGFFDNSFLLSRQLL